MPDYGDRVVVAGRKKQLVVPEAELFLPDDNVRNAKELVVRSQWFGGNYATLGELIRARTKVEFRLNEQLEDWQRELTPPCFVQYGIRDANTDARLLVWGEIPSIAAFVVAEADSARRIGPDREKFARRLTRRMENALRRGWLYGQWFSSQATRGEWGAQHKSVMQRVVPEAEFNDMREKKWA